MRLRRYDITPNGNYHYASSAPPPVAPPPVAPPPPEAPPRQPVGPNPVAQQWSNMNEFWRTQVAGSEIWNLMKDLPDAYKFAMYQALHGMGRGQNDLGGVVQHNMFGGDANAMRQWVNYWAQTNAGAAVEFDPGTGEFRYIDHGYDLDNAQYTRHLNEFLRPEGYVRNPGDSQGFVRRSWQDVFGSAYNPQSLKRIGTVPWYGYGGSDPPGQSSQFSATPVGTSPYTGIWGNPANGSASHNGPVGGGYLPPVPPSPAAPTPTAPVPPPETPPPAPVDEPRIIREPGATVAPIVTAPTVGPSATNPYAQPSNRRGQEYRFRNPGWLLSNQ